MENPENRLNAMLDSWKKQKGTAVSYAIMIDGEIAASGALGTTGGKDPQPVTKQCTCNVASISKIFCTVAVMQLVEKGLISLDTPVCEYLPEFTMPDERYKKITLRHCLSHTPGLPGTQWKGFSVCSGESYDYYKEVLDFFAHNYLKAEPGAYSAYCNDGFTLAEMVIAKMSGEKYEDYCLRHITEPLGCTSSRLLGHLNPDNPHITEGKGPEELLLIRGGAGYATTMEDLCRFGNAFLTDNPVVTPFIRDEMATPNGCTFLKKDTRSRCFGLGWDNVCAVSADYELGKGALFKVGNSFQFDTQFFVLPAYNAVLAMSETHDCGLATQEAILSLFATVMLGRGINITKRFRPVPAALKAFEGTYLTPDTILRVAMDGYYCTVTGEDSRGGRRFLKKARYLNNRTLETPDGSLRYRFEKHGRDAYMFYETAGVTIPMAQRARDGKPVSASWEKRIGRKYVAVDARPDDIVIQEIMTGFLLKRLPGTKGILVLSFSGDAGSGVYGLFESEVKPVNANVLRGFMDSPGNVSRDASTAMFFQKRGVEYVKTNSYLYREVSSLPVYAGEGFEKAAAVGEENRAYRLDKELKALPVVPEGRRIMVLDEDLTCVYDSLKGRDFAPVKAGVIVFL